MILVRQLVTPAFLLLASSCVVTTTDTSTDSSGGTDSSADTAGDTSEDTSPTCATVTPGEDWAWSLGCPQMPTAVTITVDGCELSLKYGNMTMGMPYSGTVEGDTVTFADDNSVTGCVGTVESADKITGTCGDGCEFKLKRPA